MSKKMQSLAELEALAFQQVSTEVPVAQPEAGNEIVATATSVAVCDPLPEPPVVDEVSRLRTEAYDRFDAALQAAALGVPTFKAPEDLVEHVRTTVLTAVSTEEMVANLAAAAAAYLDSAKSPVGLAVISGRENDQIQETLAAMKDERDSAYAEVHLLKKENESLQKNPPVFWPVRVGAEATNVLKRDKGVWAKFSSAVATEEALVAFFIKDLELRHDLNKAIGNERHSARVAKALAQQVADLKAAGATPGTPSVAAARDAETIKHQEATIGRLQQQLQAALKGAAEGALVAPQDQVELDRLGGLVKAQEAQLLALREKLAAPQVGTVSELKALAAAIRGAARFNIPGISPELLLQAVEKL